MILKYLGTAAAEGFPAMFCKCAVCERARRSGGRNIRTRSQAIVDEELLIDFPADTYLHVLYGGLRLEKVRNLIITHAHSDHLYPADFEMRREGFAHGLSSCLTVYGTSAVISVCRGIPHIALLEVQGRIAFKQIVPFEPFEAGGYRITPLAANHDAAAGPVFYLVEKGNEALLYANDTGYFPEETWQYLEKSRPGIGLVSFDCTCGIYDNRNGHLGFHNVLEVRERLYEIGCISQESIIAITHFSHNGGATYDEMCETAEKEQILVAYDGMKIEV